MPPKARLGRKRKQEEVEEEPSSTTTTTTTKLSKQQKEEKKRLSILKAKEWKEKRAAKKKGVKVGASTTSSNDDGKERSDDKKVTAASPKTAVTKKTTSRRSLSTKGKATSTKTTVAKSPTKRSSSSSKKDDIVEETPRTKRAKIEKSTTTTSSTVPVYSSPTIAMTSPVRTTSQQKQQQQQGPQSPFSPYNGQYHPYTATAAATGGAEMNHVGAAYRRLVQFQQMQMQQQQSYLQQMQQQQQLHMQHLNTNNGLPFGSPIATTTNTTTTTAIKTSTKKKPSTKKKAATKKSAEKKSKPSQPLFKQQQPANIVVEATKEPAEEEEEEETMEETTTSTTSIVTKLFKYIKYTCFIALFGYIIIMALYSLLSSTSSSSTTFLTSSSSTIHQSDKPIYFRNFGFQSSIDDGGVDIEIINPNHVADCDTTQYQVEDCPKYGKCLNGKLLECTDDDDHINYSAMDDDESNNNENSGFWVISDNGLECVLSSKAVEDMMALHGKIVQLIVDMNCKNGGSDGDNQLNINYKVLPDGDVVFDLLSVADSLKMDKSIIYYLVQNMEDGPSKLLIESIKDEEDLKMKEWIGLSKEYIDKGLPIPAHCWVKLVSLDLASYAWNKLSALMRFVCKVLWDVSNAYPIPTASFVLIVFIVYWIKSKRNRVITLRHRVAEIQDLAYDKLVLDCNVGEGCAALHLRDDIVHELYPTDNAQRKTMIQNVWPRVCAAVRMDNRVRKSTKSVGGKQLEWWEWVADAQRKARTQKKGEKVLKVE